jgi:hypothetical protein
VAHAELKQSPHERIKMKNRSISSKLISPRLNPAVTIRVSGKLFQGHLPYLDQLLQFAIECELWPHLNLAHLEELDRAALFYLIDGEDRDFNILLCPGFVRDWMEHERDRAVA